MEYLTQELSKTSSDMEAEVRAKSRQFTSALDTTRWLSQELSKLAHTALEISSPESREAWLKRVYTNLRLHYVVQVEQQIAMSQSPNSLAGSREAEVAVIDILAENTAWARLCVMGSGTYEQLLHRLRAMAIMGITVETTCDEYVNVSSM